MNKFIEIESQLNETYLELWLLYRVLELAKEAGYTHVRDNWGLNAWDTYTIDEAIEKFKPSIEKL